MNALANVPATARQITFITDLVKSRIVSAEHQARLLATIDAGKLDKNIASKTIDWLKLQPVRPAEVIIEPTPEQLMMQVEEGMNRQIAEALLPDVPEGRYAVEHKGVLKFFKVDRPTEGRWAGRTFVKVQASDDWFSIRPTVAKNEILALIGNDVQQASLRYGRELGHCGVCGRTLTDENSRARGIGPICADKTGW